MAADGGLGKRISIFLEILLYVQLIQIAGKTTGVYYQFGLTIDGPQSLRDFKLKDLRNASDVIAAKRAKLFELQNKDK